MSRLWITGHLFLLSVEDMREGRISMLLVAELGLTGLARMLRMGGAAEWIPGTLLLCLGCVTKEKIGYGDGWLVLALGMWLSLYELFFLLELGILFCVVFALLTGRKELPLVPFLTAAYVLGGWI